MAPTSTENGTLVDPPASATTISLLNGSINDSVLCLRSDEQAQLLDAIDALRRAKLADANIDTPQIVVCGEQSSGKSSVLQAIANVPFPVDIGTTTRFATELVLRRSDVLSETSGNTVTIDPAPERTPKVKAQLIEFKHALTGPENIGRAIEAAHEHLKRSVPGESFFKDRLRIEINGPEQPHLTIVDLPGIIHSESKKNAQPGDMSKVRDLVNSYIQSPRAIVIAVFNAEMDEDSQEILQLIDGPPAGAVTNVAGNPGSKSIRDRTLGVITKPDRVEGEERKRNIISIANNEEAHLTVGFGWHMVKNLGEDHHGKSIQCRNREEEEFFVKSEWSGLNSDNIGITKLTQKLKNHLMDCILANLPNLIAEIKARITRCETTIANLGQERESVRDQRSYLYDKMACLQKLTEQALEGEYKDTSFFDGTKEKKLRDTIRNSGNSFQSRLRHSGHQYHIHEEYVKGSRKSRFEMSDPVCFIWLINGRDKSFKDVEINFLGPNFAPPYLSGSATTTNMELKPRNISLSSYCKALAEYLKSNKGKTPPAWPTWQNGQSIFRQQSIFWNPLAKAYGDECRQIVHRFLALAVAHVACEDTKLEQALWKDFVIPELTSRGSEVQKKTEELIWPFMHSHPMWSTEDDPRRPTPASRPESSTNGEVAEVPLHTFGEIARQALWYSPELAFAADALDLSQSYYEAGLPLNEHVARRTFAENVPALAIERCLLYGLEQLSAPKKVFDMTDYEISLIASESSKVRADRETARAHKDGLNRFLAQWEHRARFGNVFTGAPATDRADDKIQSSEKSAAKSSSAQSVLSDLGGSSSSKGITYVFGGSTEQRPEFVDNPFAPSIPKSPTPSANAFQNDARRKAKVKSPAAPDRSPRTHSPAMPGTYHSPWVETTSLAE